MILYKYVPPARIDILKNQFIRFSSINEFNDPFEFSIHLTADDDAVKHHILTKQLTNLKKSLFTVMPALKSIEHQLNYKELLNQHYHKDQFLDFYDWKKTLKSINNNLSKTIAILSLSEVDDNLLMWGHYTNNHTGMVIGIEIDEKTFVNTSPPRKITYQDEKVNLHLTNLEDVSQTPNVNKISNEAIFTKSIHWAYEQEWRTITSFDFTETKDGTNGLVKINPLSIVKVILGTNADDSLKEEIMNLKKRNNDYKNLDIFQASLGLKNYELDFEQIC